MQIAVKSRTQDVWILFVSLCMTVNGRTREKANVGWYCILYSFKFCSQYSRDLCQLLTSLIEQSDKTPSQSFVYMSQQIAFLRFQNLCMSFERQKCMYVTTKSPYKLILYLSENAFLRLLSSPDINCKARRQNEGESKLRTKAGTSALYLLLFKEKKSQVVLSNLGVIYGVTFEGPIFYCVINLDQSVAHD